MRDRCKEGHSENVQIDEFAVNGVWQHTAEQHRELCMLRAERVLSRDEFYKLKKEHWALQAQLQKAEADAAHYLVLWEQAVAVIQGRAELEKDRRPWWKRWRKIKDDE